MKKRLSKIARDFKSNISIVVEFLRVNGYECEEDPEVEFSIEVVEFIENNLPAFLFDYEDLSSISIFENIKFTEKDIDAIHTNSFLQ